MKNYNYQGTYVHSNRILHTPSEFARENLLYLQESLPLPESTMINR